MEKSKVWGTIPCLYLDNIISFKKSALQKL